MMFLGFFLLKKPAVLLPFFAEIKLPNIKYVEHKIHDPVKKNRFLYNIIVFFFRLTIF
ncbi:hypothetical protein HanRHA438_Chr10g0464991 [Helianthus annuus]|nr:hypothetical protein HanRHA438_Chr10g0464991 [Helianthus annuus]